jgi:hypothetical protein
MIASRFSSSHTQRRQLFLPPPQSCEITVVRSVLFCAQIILQNQCHKDDEKFFHVLCQVLSIGFVKLTAENFRLGALAVDAQPASSCFMRATFFWRNRLKAFNLNSTYYRQMPNSCDTKENLCFLHKFGYF